VVAWAWDFGDGYASALQNPSHTYAAGGSYTVQLTVADAQDAQDVATEPVTVVEPPPVLSASGLKIKGVNVVDLTWTGTIKPVDLYRDGALIVAGASSTAPSYRDDTGRRGKATFVYRACLAGTTNCSSNVSVVF
jgi:PKD repeat protein